MKKILVLVAFLLLGCSKKEVVCNIHIDNDKQDYEVNTSYTIHYKNSFVTKVLIDEEYISNDENVIHYFDNYLKLTYLTFEEQYGNIKYEDQEIKNGVRYRVNIDYSKIKGKDMIKNKYIDKDYVVNNRVTLGGLINLYESKGAKCNGN